MGGGEGFEGGVDVALEGAAKGGEDRSADLAEMSDLLGRPVELLPFPEKAVSASSELKASWPAWAIPLGLTLREGAAYRAAGVNLLVGPFAPAHSRAPWRRSLIAAGERRRKRGRRL